MESRITPPAGEDTYLMGSASLALRAEASSEQTPVGINGDLDLMLPSAEEQSLFRQRITNMVRCSQDTFLHFIDEVNHGFATPSAAATLLGAFPTLFAPVTRATTYSALIMMAADLGIHIAADRNISKAELIHKINAALSTAANTFTFALKLYIAIYLAIRQMGTQRVDVSDLQYDGMFLVPTVIFSLAHGALKYSEKQLLNANFCAARLLRGSFQALEAINKTSNINALLLLGLTKYGYSEVGDVNPYVRFGLFMNILMVGTILQVISNYGNRWNYVTGQLVNAISATTYASSLFMQPTSEAFSQSAKAMMAIYIGLMALLTGTLTYLFPIAEERQETHTENSRPTTSENHV